MTSTLQPSKATGTAARPVDAYKIYGDEVDDTAVRALNGINVEFQEGQRHHGSAKLDVLRAVTTE